MINWVMKKYGSVKPVVIDGFLYVVIAVCGIITAVLTSKEVYEYMNPYLVFYGKFLNEIIGGAATALKMYRSTSYSEHRNAEDAKVISPDAPAEPKPIIATNSNLPAHNQ